MFKQKDNTYPMKMLDPTLMTAFDTIKYNPKEDPPELTEENLKDLT